MVMLSTILGATQVMAAEKTADVYLLTNNANEHGIGQKIGTITFKDTKKGLEIKPDLHGLPPGQHGFHIHQNPACEGGEKDNHWEAGLAAGPHLDPEHTNMHLGPYKHGHLGDLPFLMVQKNGKVVEKLLAPHLSVAKIEGHSLIIHEHGDNYSDLPQPLGGGGPRIACGVVK